MKLSAENSRKKNNADFSVAKKWDYMRTGWEILPDGEFCEANCLSKEGKTPIQFALLNTFFGIKNPHVDLPLGMIWPKREDEDNSIAIDIEATVTRIIVVYKRVFFN